MCVCTYISVLEWTCGQYWSSHQGIQKCTATASMRAHTHTHTHTHTHMCTHAHARTHARTHTRTHARTHAHTHTHTHTLLCSLQPIRLCILGPPAVGKTTVVTQLCTHYKLHHISLGEVIKESIAKLVSTQHIHTHTVL